MSNIKIYLQIPVYFLCCCFALQAQTLSRESLVNFAKEYVEQQLTAPDVGHLQVHIPSIDPRIKIKPCQVPLSANIPENITSRNVNIKISCEDSKPWTLFLPVKVRTMIPVVVTNATINKKTVLDNSNLVVVYKDQKKVHGEVLSDLNQLIGTKAKRNLSIGTKITKRNVCFVCKGDDVTIIAKSNDFMIKTAGVALRDGAIGDKVSVRNKRSNRTVTAQVNAINKVVINL